MPVIISGIGHMIVSLSSVISERMVISRDTQYLAPLLFLSITRMRNAQVFLSIRAPQMVFFL